ncbi:oligosaccharyl transferase, STT3 subunit [Nautilia profundicola AmH]|uniref:Oligosaccharyl transferase, STT3 subunit n=1 Tax=Nautilia profundicola (strain ATCC BAA-1463 / DSM 18972 / AmH) TaxID=598659 RepID=B9L6P4_NAUPA|nr:STT3 domain-containing protein [Nautilia profundicola]ACM92784.1 oligosaccharyl transferase, STT3 subunit [Nautilia profundicola AmH]
MKEYLNIQEIRFSNKTAFVLISFAYVFATAVRYYYFSWASGIKEFLWHGTLMINNVDGYYYAAGAKELLNNSHVVGNLNPYHSLPSLLTAAIVKLFPFLSLDEVILWMPAVFGSLLVVPLFLIGRSFKNDILGLTAALIGGIVWSYYNRTMVGYYDTDMLVIVLLMFIVWGIIEYLVNDNRKMFLFVPLMIVLYEWWYPQSRTVLLALVGMSFIYISAFKRKQESFVFVLFLLVALFGFKFYINALLIAILYVVYIKKLELFLNWRVIYWLFGISIIMLFLSGTMDMFINKFLVYFNRSDTGEEGLHFYNVSKTIREASQIPFDVVANRISGGMGLFIFSLIGYVLMVIRYPVMIISLPMVVIGIMAHKLGLRFTIYAVPFFALGFAYLVLLISEYVSKLFINDKVAKISKIILPLILITPSLYANIKHVINYKTPTTFLSQEVESLNKLSHIAKPEDYVVTWWDYGYPIRYYAGTKTLVDGGKHSGEVNFPVSFALTHNQTAAANIARLDVEYTDKVEVARELGKEFETEGFIKDMMKKYGFKDPNGFLNALNNPNFKLPEKTRDVYFYFPFRMADIFPTVAVFSSIDLKTGKVNQPFIVSTRVVAAGKEGLKFANGIWMDMKGYLHWGQKLIPLKAAYLGLYDKTGKYRVVKQPFHSNSNIVLIWYKPLNRVLILSTDKLDATYVQMFFFENYDPKLFEPVILNSFVKIYKLKK